jgi:hypothetical protein
MSQNGQIGSLLVLLAALCLTKSLLCNVVVIIRDVVFFRIFKNISEKLFQVFKEDYVHISTQKSRIPCFRPDGQVMPLDALQCQEAEKFKVGRHGNTSRCFSEFEKILAFLHRHEVGRQLAPVQTPGQNRPNAEILDKEIMCNYMQTKCNRLNAASLNMETHESCYGKSVAQKTVRMLNASVQTPPRENRLDLGLLSL